MAPLILPTSTIPIRHDALTIYSSPFSIFQSGFEKEMRSGRTLAIKGVKDVKIVVQNINATRHSYTIQPTVSMTGRLLSKFLLILKETTGSEFGPNV